MTFFSFKTFSCCLCKTISLLSIVFKAKNLSLDVSCTRLTRPNVPDPRMATCCRSWSCKARGGSTGLPEKNAESFGEYITEGLRGWGKKGYIS